VQGRNAHVNQVGKDGLAVLSPVPFGVRIRNRAALFGLAQPRVAAAPEDFFDQARLAHAALATNKHDLEIGLGLIDSPTDGFQFVRSVDEPRRPLGCEEGGFTHLCASCVFLCKMSIMVAE